MPYLGRTSFLRAKMALEDYQMSRVNALSRAHFISTKKNVEVMMNNEVCQCPISGALHFYCVNASSERNADMCQCPISGALHFYIMKRNEMKKMLGVSMPYLGRTSFLRKSL